MMTQLRHVMRSHVMRTHDKVEKVVGWHWKNKRLKTNYQYKVKWKGYPASEDLWQPVENLTNCSEMVEAFHARNPNAPRPPPLPSVSSRSCCRA